MSLDLAELGAAAADWKMMADSLGKLSTYTQDGLVRKSERARWKGENATVTREFVHKTAKEIADLRAEAESLAAVLVDAHAELSSCQRRARSLTDAARSGNPSHNPPDPALIVMDGPDGTVRVVEAMCTPEGPNQRTKDYLQWYADTLGGIVRHAAEIDAAAVRALRKSHGNDPHNAGHAAHTSLDEEQLPRAEELIALGSSADAQQRAELKRLWESLSPEARARLWLAKKDDLMAAGVLSPTMPQVAADAGAGRHGSESPGSEEWITKSKMQLLTEGADWKGMSDASRNMAHYLGNTGTPMGLPVDKMMTDVPAFKTYADETVRANQNAWRERALEEFRKNGGKPVAFPVEAKQGENFYFTKEIDQNWFYAVGGANSSVTGVVTAVPDAHGNPKVGIDYQVNVWDRYNWDEGKSVTIGLLHIPDGQMAKLHRTGLAQEFDMEGSSSIRHHDLGSSTTGDSPLSGSQGNRDGRVDPGREQQQGRTVTKELGRTAIR
ncbi:hypothetical protein [Streptomyces cinereoruber]|uniref:hypothetical protein n=1 Tax=Streptomyces cinereoruber TaxID=67260 RepID=UPI00363D145A